MHSAGSHTTSSTGSTSCAMATICALPFSTRVVMWLMPYLTTTCTWRWRSQHTAPQQQSNQQTYITPAKVRRFEADRKRSCCISDTAATVAGLGRPAAPVKTEARQSRWSETHRLLLVRLRALLPGLCLCQQPLLLRRLVLRPVAPCQTRSAYSAGSVTTTASDRRCSRQRQSSTVPDPIPAYARQLPQQAPPTAITCT